MTNLMHAPKSAQNFTVYRVGIVDRAAMFREGLAALFASTSDFRVVLLSERLEEALQRPLAATVSIWLVAYGEAIAPPELDIAPSASRAMDSWRNGFADASFILVDDARDENRSTCAIEYGYDGYVSKLDSFERLLVSLQRLPGVENGGVNTNASWYYLAGSSDDAGTSRTIRLLTDRERQVLTHLAGGHSVKVCSQMLNIAPSTIENHKAKIMKKLRVHKAVDLVRIAIRAGLVHV